MYEETYHQLAACACAALSDRNGYLDEPAVPVNLAHKLAADLCDDAITRKMVEEFVEGEESHCGWVAKHLAIIEKLGYDNYLLEMMDI